MINLCRSLKSHEAFRKEENYDKVAIIHSTFSNLLKTTDFISETNHGNAYLLLKHFFYFDCMPEHPINFDVCMINLHGHTSFVRRQFDFFRWTLF